MTGFRAARKTLIAFVVAGALAASLAGCTPTIATKPASDANNPKCADVIVELPSTIAGKKRDYTNAQSTGAWGSPVAVQLACGVKPLGPTTKPCITVSGVDWVLLNNPDADTLEYQTFGRTPATQVSILHGKNGVSDADVLPDLSQAIERIPQATNEKCIGTGTEPTPSS